MLTLIESISLAGDRGKQNDDACGFADARAWVIDGATDLHDAPLSGAASDAAWLAHCANTLMYASAWPADEAGMRNAVRAISIGAREQFMARAGALPKELWKSPLASLLAVAETTSGLAGLDLGDCRLFVSDGQAIGGPPSAADNETQLASDAAKRTGGGAALLRDAGTMALLREKRAAQIARGGSGTLCLYPECAEQARTWTLAIARPAHVLIATDGFSALVDRYGAYDAAGLVGAARTLGLQALGAQLRAIEAEDAGGARHPRWKRSDDATAVLLRLS